MDIISHFLFIDITHNHTSASLLSLFHDWFLFFFRITKQVPFTKASLGSSFPLGLIRRSKIQDNSSDKKPQPMKALPRPVMKSSRNSNVESQSSHLPRTTVGIG